MYNRLKFVPNIFTIHKSFLGSYETEVPQIGPDRFSRVDVYWTKTDRQINKQSIRIEEWYRLKRTILMIC